MQHELHVAQWSDVLTHDYLLRIDWMAAPAAKCGFSLSRFPDARPRGQCGGNGRQRRAPAAGHETSLEYIRRFQTIAGFKRLQVSNDCRFQTIAGFKRLFESYTKIPPMCKRWPRKSGTATCTVLRALALLGMARFFWSARQSWTVPHAL